MGIHAEKRPEREHDALTRSESGQRSRGDVEALAQARAPLTAQARLQHIADTGKPAMQLRALRELAGNSPRSRQSAQLQARIAGQPSDRPLQQKTDVVQKTVWEWAGSHWNAVRTEGAPTAQPTSPGTSYGERVSTGSETDLWKAEPKKSTKSEPPKGFTLVSDRMGAMQAYLSDPNNLTPSGVPLDHLIEAANGIKSKIHQSSKMKGTSHSTYVHPNDDELITFSLQGNHSDAIPMITIHEQGQVRGGVHKF